MILIYKIINISFNYFNMYYPLLVRLLFYIAIVVTW